MNKLSKKEKKLGEDGMENNPVIFEVKNLVKKYATVNAVDGASAAIKKGEAVFIVGPSGSGKSTFLRCLNKLEHPTSGEILFHGKKVSDNPRAENHFRENVGMVFQHFNLFPHLTIKENITLAPVQTKRLTKAEASKVADELLARIGLAEKAAELFPKIAELAYRMVSGCSCVSGCPSCIHSPKCGNNNQMLDKAGTVELLSYLVKEMK